MNTYRPDPYQWVILVVATLVVFASLGLARFGYSVVLPAMQKGLFMDNTQAGVLASVNLAGYLVMSALGGALAARFGPRLVIAVGLSVVGLGMILTGMAATVFSAGVYRTLTGIGSGARSRVVPRFTCQRISPLERSMAWSWPQGGGLQGMPRGESTTSRIIP